MVHKTLQKTKYCNNNLTELLCPGIVSSSCSTSGTPCAHNVKNLIISANSDHTNEMSILMSKSQRIIPISYRASTSSND